MSGDLREELFKSLAEEVTKISTENPKVSKLFKISQPKNGPTIKLNGIVLFKVLKISNPWSYRGVAIHKHILPHALEKINGKLMKDGKWAGCALTTHNYDDLKKILLEIIRKSVFSKIKLKTAKTRVVPKKKNINL